MIFGKKFFNKNFWGANKQRIQVGVHTDKTKKQKKKKRSSLMCFVEDKVSRACIGKAFPYRIPKTLKEAHNLIFFFFFNSFSKIEWEREEHNIWIFREEEIERFMNLVKLMKSMESTSVVYLKPFEVIYSRLRVWPTISTYILIDCR